MKRPFLSSESSVITRTGLYTCLVAMVLALSATGCSGGGGSGGGLPPGNNTGPLDIPELDDHGGNTFDSTIIYPGQEITTGFINFVNDVDYFKFSLIQDQWYGIQNIAHKNGDYNLNLNVHTGLGFQLFDSTGGIPLDPPNDGIIVPNSTDWGWPPGADIGGDQLEFPSSGNRLMWQAPYTGNYYYAVSPNFGNVIGAYAFKLASTQFAYSQPLHSGKHDFTKHESYNIRSFVDIRELVDGVLLPRLVGPAIDSADAQLVFLEGGAGIISFGMDNFGSWDIVYYHYVSSVRFLDDEGVLKEEPENRVAHIHWGIPSRDMSDGVDDIFWNDNNIPGFDPGPNFNAVLDINYNAGDDPPYLLQTDINANFGFDESFIHLMIGADWYMDVHLSDNLSAYGLPIASSLPQGGIKMFDSSYFLNGDSEFPEGEATGSLLELEVAYDDEFQIFYMPYGDILDHSELFAEGATLHVHAGESHQTDNTILLDLGPIPPVQERPIYEGGFPFYPGIENVIYELSDAEAKILNDATYSTLWYLDLHTAPNFVDSPLLRANSFLGGNLEVGITRHANTPSLRSGGSGVAVGAATFVTDDLAYGPILVKLNGKDIGQIGADSESVFGDLAPNNYRYVAYADGVFWSGHVAIEDGVETTVVLKAADAQPQD